MEQKRPQMPAKKQKQSENLTLREFLQWMKRRKLLRRRYMRDSISNENRSHGVHIVCFVLLLMLCMAFGMTQANFARQGTAPDAVTYQHSTAVSPNPAIHMDDVMCTVHVTVGTGETQKWLTPTATVGEILRDMGFVRGEDDFANVPFDTVCEDGMDIRVTLVTYETHEDIVSIPFGTEYVDVQTIPEGTTERISHGVMGVAHQTQKRRYENGVHTATEVLSETVDTAPINERLLRGIGGTVSGVDGTFHFSYYIDVTATAYGPPKFTGLTYTGIQVREGIIAVDPNVIPLHSKVYVKDAKYDLGICYAEDIGGGIKNKRIDVFLNQNEDGQKQFGRRENVRVYIISNDCPYH